MKLKDLLDPSKTYRVKPSKRLGEGAQGEVTLIDGFENNPSSYALKLYHCPPSTPQGQHLIHFVQYIRSQGQLKASPSLPLPLWAVEEEDEHRVGCIMRLISGRPPIVLSIMTFILTQTEFGPDFVLPAPWLKPLQPCIDIRS